MPVSMDVFRSDAFNTVSMTDALLKLPYKPSRIDAMKLFEVKGIPTTTVAIEEKSGRLALVPNTSRLAGPNRWGGDNKRKVRTFRTTHLPLEDTLLADDIQNRRAFGTASELQSVAAVVGDRLLTLRQSIEVTIEFLRMGALQGRIVDADGVTVIYDLFTEFGLVRETRNFELDNPATSVRNKVLDLQTKIESLVGAMPMDHVHVMCGTTFFRTLINHADVKAMYERHEDGAALRNDPRSGFTIGKVIFEENSTTTGLGTTPWIPATKAAVFPVGVPGLFLDYRAPANWMETANTNGLPLYAKTERMKYDQGVHVQVQSNPLPLCAMPEVLIELVMSA